MLLSEEPPRSASPIEPGVGETVWPVSLRVPPVSAFPGAKVRSNAPHEAPLHVSWGLNADPHVYRASTLQTEPSPGPLNTFL